MLEEDHDTIAAVLLTSVCLPMSAPALKSWKTVTPDSHPALCALEIVNQLIPDQPILPEWEGEILVRFV